MKNLSYFMKRPYKIELIEYPEEGGYTAALPELPGCLTCGKTMDEALANLKDAKKHGCLPLWKMAIPSLNLPALKHSPANSNYVSRNPCIEI